MAKQRDVLATVALLAATLFVPACGNEGSRDQAPGGSGGASGAGASGGSGGASGSGGAPGSGGTSGAGASAGSGGASGSAIGNGALVSPYLVGQNLWYPSSVASLWPTVKASGVRLIRIGGNGPNKTVPSNGQYLEWCQQIRAIGAEPLVQVSQLATAQEAAALVTFLNGVNAQKIELWSIGNEPDLDAVPVSEVAAYVRGHASKMKEADPSIRIFAPDLAWYDEPYLTPLIGGSDDITGKDQSGRYYIDGVTFHTYPNGEVFDRAKAIASAGGVRNNVKKLVALLAAANTKHARTGTDALGWGLGEFNITYKNPAANAIDGYAVRSFLNGQFFAEIFGIAMEHSATFAAPWSIHESSGAGGPLDLGYLDGPLAEAKPRASYWHLQLVASHFRGRYAAGTTNQPLVKAFGAGAGDELAVMIANQELSTSFHFTLRLSTGKAPSSDPLDIEVDSALDASSSGDIGPQATAVLLFDEQGTLTQRIDYRLADAQAWKPPE